MKFVRRIEFVDIVDGGDNDDGRKTVWPNHIELKVEKKYRNGKKMFHSSCSVSAQSHRIENEPTIRWPWLATKKQIDGMKGRERERDPFQIWLF